MRSASVRWERADARGMLAGQTSRWQAGGRGSPANLRGSVVLVMLVRAQLAQVEETVEHLILRRRAALVSRHASPDAVLRRRCGQRVLRKRAGGAEGQHACWHLCKSQGAFKITSVGAFKLREGLIS